ncbi:MAG: Trm112 family protein [Planctomycetota bacterium]|jgi:uncharacterized protein YbaR (Trm112 family)
MAEVDKELLEILVCPQSKASLVQVGDWLYSTDPQTRRRYPIRDGIPIMLIDESSQDRRNRLDPGGIELRLLPTTVAN